MVEEIRKKNDSVIEIVANIIGNFVFFFSLWIITTFISKISDRGYYDVGIFNLAMTFCNIFTTFSTFASRGYMVSDLKKEFSYHIYVSMRIGTVIVSCTCCIILAFIMGYRGEVFSAIVFYMLYRCCDAYSDVFHAIMQIEGRLKFAAYSMILKSILSSVLFAVSLWFYQNLIFSMALMVGSGICINLLYDQRKVIDKYKSSLWEKLKTSIHTLTLLSRCLPLMINGVVMTLLVAIPRLILEKLSSTSVLGVYAAVTAPTVIISTFATSLATPLLSYCANAWFHKKGKELYLFIFLPLTLICICIVIGVPLGNLFGSIILSFLYTEDISIYVDLFIMACVSACILAGVTLENNLLIVARKTKNIVLFSGIACVVTVILSLPLIMKWGMYGATYTLIIAYSIELIVQIVFLCFLVRKHLKEVNNE